MYKLVANHVVFLTNWHQLVFFSWLSYGSSLCSPLLFLYLLEVVEDTRGNGSCAEC
jgi:hypothetical protein